MNAITKFDKAEPAKLPETLNDEPAREALGEVSREAEAKREPVAPAALPASAPVAAPASAMAPEPQPAPAKPKRRGTRYFLMAALPLALVAGGSYVYVTGGRIQETENANIRQPRVIVASQVSGRIAAVNFADNQTVKGGDVLFTVDPAPYRIALQQAEASLAGARLQVEQLRSAYGQAVAQEQSANNEVSYLKTELGRQSALNTRGIAARSSLDTAQRDLDKARDASRAAAQAVAGAKAALGGDPDIETDTHPSVLAALAARDKAAYDLDQTTVRAPTDGIISQAASVKAGQFVAIGTGLFSLVETGDTWIDANFKETQLTHMTVGQEAEVELDTFPGQPLHAKVDAIGAGTGAEFSLLPAQNATGNWVKVTQRIPVRLKLEENDANLLLRTGMSADVSVDTGMARGIPHWIAEWAPGWSTAWAADLNKAN